MSAQPRRGPWPAVFGLCVVLAGARSIALGKDINWDLKNYHYYNAWAFLNDRLGFDLAPAQLQTYHSPFVELPFYWLVNAVSEPRVVAFAMALPAAIAGFFLVRILALLFPFDRERANGVLWIAAAAAIGLTGAAGAAAWGTTMNEWPSAALTLAALWLCMRATLEGEARRRFAWPAAGALLGIAVALKLTFGAYALGLLAGALMAGTVRQRLRRALVAGTAMAVAFVVAYGPWAWVLWREFANPFFPYFNAIFQSPWWAPSSFFDRNFGPASWRQWIFFPLAYAREYRLVSEVSFRDYRLATLLVLALAAWGMSRWRNLRENPNAAPPEPDPLHAAWRVLAAFALVSYLAWLKAFGIFRYLVVLEAISGALIVGCVLYVLQRGRPRIALVALLTVLLVGTTRVGDWGRGEFGEAYFDIRAPEIAPGSLVIVGYSHPMAYAAPFFRRDARFVSPANNFILPGQKSLIARRAEELIRGHPGPAYLLEYKVRNGHDERTLAYFGFVSDPATCIPVPSSLDADYLRICPLRRP